MKRLRLLTFAIAATTVLVVSVAAQTSLSLWPYYIDVTPQGSRGFYDVIVPQPVMDRATTDLGDLRLFDNNNREIPYAIRIRREVDEKREIRAQMFNSATTGPTSSEVSVDLGDDAGDHNEIEVDTSGSNFRRQVSVEGSDSGTDWRTLTNNGLIFSFESEKNGTVESGRVSYPTSRYRYLRVRVARDPIVDKEAPAVTEVRVLMSVREQGLRSSWSVSVGAFQLLRNQGAYASAFMLDLGGRAPCDRLTIDFYDQSFSRPFEVESLDDPDNVRSIATGTLTRHAGQNPQPLTITFDHEEYVRKLRLVITDYSNPTLNISSVEASAPARQLIFEMKEPSPALRLYFGNAKVTEPHYDFEKELPLRLNGEPSHTTISDPQPNPQYQPEPKPLTERVPWLIYLVLIASSVALGYILFSLARTATRINTAADNAPPPS